MISNSLTFPQSAINSKTRYSVWKIYTAEPKKVIESIEQFWDLKHIFSK